MPGRVKAAVPLLLLVLAQSAIAQCNWTLRSSDQFRSSVLDVAVDGNELWTATGYGVEVLDRTVDPPSVIASAGLPDTTRIVRPVGNGIAYAGSGSKVYVLRRNGRSLEVVRSVNAGGTVNDFALATYLFVATSNGISHFDIFDPANPTRTNTTLSTSSANVTSLSVTGSTLYAADGDSTVETFSISAASLPQRTGALSSLSRSISVNATPSLVYVSDGQNTDIFLTNGGTSAIARTSVGSTSFAQLGTSEHFVAGTDRAVHAVDFSVGNNPAELFEQQLPPTPGTINRISGMQLAGSRLYVAAGDIGLATFDVSAFTKPYPVRSLGTGSATSALLIGTTAWVTPSAGGISSFHASGNVLTSSGSTDAGTSWVLRDRAGATWLATSGTRAKLGGGYTATFPKTIISAASDGATILAVLEDDTLWSVATVTDATPQKTALPFAPTLVSRSGEAVALAELTATGNTNVHYYSTRDFTSAPRTFTIPGAVIGTVSLSATHAAAVTYKGVNVVDLASGAVTQLPGSEESAAVARQVVLAGSRVLELTDRSLLVWDAVTRRLVREILLPADSVAMDADASLAVIATVDGVTSVSYAATQGTPQLLAIRNANRYYSKIVAAEDRLYTFGENGVDVLSTSIGYKPMFVTGLRLAGLVDIAATDDNLYTLAGSGVVTAYSPAGGLVAQTALNEGPDSQPLGIFTAGSGVWVSYSTGCLTGTCQKKTLVLDPQTLGVTATMNGGVVDVITTGRRAFALFSLPSELRVIDNFDPKHPVQQMAKTIEGVANSVAYYTPTIYVAGAQVQAFDEMTLAPLAKDITPVTADPIDRVRVDGRCVVLTGKTFPPELHERGATPKTIAMPGAVRGLAVWPGRLYFLTDTSIETWSTTAATQPSRRRATR